MTARSTSTKLVLVVVALLLLVVEAPTAARASTAQAQLSPYKFVHVPGAKLGYREAGRGRPLVLIAGFGLTAAEWDPSLVRKLAARRRVIVFDNRGVGTSTGSMAHLTIDLMARDTASLIAKLRLRRPDVLGWSMGGYIAQELALRHPRSLRRLILAATDPGGPTAVQPKPVVLRLLTDPKTGPFALLPILFPHNQQAAGRAWFERIGAEPGLLPDSLVVAPAALAAQSRASGPRWTGIGDGTWARLPRLDLRVLVADGKDDVVVPTRNSRLLARRIPKARLKLYPDAGHAFLIQDRNAFVPVVQRFLTRP